MSARAPPKSGSFQLTSKLPLGNLSILSSRRASIALGLDTTGTPDENPAALAELPVDGHGLRSSLAGVALGLDAALAPDSDPCALVGFILSVRADGDGDGELSQVGGESDEGLELHFECALVGWEGTRS